MADSVIGALRVVLGLDTAAFTQGAKDAQSTLDGLGKAFKTALAGLGVGLSLGAFVSSIKHAIDAADELGKASQKFGVPVEQLSALKFAADLADVSFESLGKGLGKLSKAMLDSAANPAGEAAKNFKALGISVTDAGGNVKSTEVTFGDIAEKFSTMQDGATKTALAIRIFGRAGADLIPLLNEGRAGLRTLTDEAKSLGIVISNDTAAKAQEFNDTLKRLQTVQGALSLQMAEAMLPVLQKVANAFLQASQEGGGFKALVSEMSTSFVTDIEDVQKIALAFENLARIFIAFKSAGAALASGEGITAALKIIGDAVDENVRKFQALQRSFLSLGSAGAFDSMENLPAMMAKVARGFGTVDMSALGAKNAIDQFIKSQEKTLASNLAEAQTLGAVVGTHEAMRITMEANAIAKANDIKLTDAQRVALKNLSDQAGATAVQIAGAKLTQEFLTPWDLYLQKVRDVNAELAANAISSDTARKASFKAANDMAQVYGQAAAGAMGDFATFFTTFAQGNKEMYIVAKAFSVSQAIINALLAATKALATLPPPLGQIAAAASLAAGMAMVAKIVAEKPTTGMALGGSFQVAGAGGVDSQMVPIMATPGERVHVEQNKYGDSGSGKTITLQGLSPKQYYRGDVLRDLVDNLNTAIGDGLKIKLA